MEIAEKSAEKPVEKAQQPRRALGRGLDSLLPSGPRVVAPVATMPASVSAQVVTSSSAPQPGYIGDMTGAVDDAATKNVVIGDMEAAAGRRDTVQEISLDLIDDNPHQTRRFFDEDSLRELAASIKESGLAQPIVVRPGENGRYVLVLGERRCRASKMIKKETITALVRRVNEQQAAELTVIENLQRQDLNCMEQAAAFMKLSQNFNMTQDEIGKRVGLSRETVANYMRLMKLPGEVMKYLMDGMMSFTDAKSLLRLDDDPELMVKVAHKAWNEKMSSVQLDDLVDDIRIRQGMLDPEKKPTGRGSRWVDPNVRAVQGQLQRTLGTKVKISDRKGRGKIVIEYASIDDFYRVVEVLMGGKKKAAGY